MICIVSSSYAKPCLNSSPYPYHNPYLSLLLSELFPARPPWGAGHPLLNFSSRWYCPSHLLPLFLLAVPASAATLGNLNAKAELCCSFGYGWSRSGANVTLHPLTALSFRRLDLELALQAEVLSLQLVQAESPDALTGCCTCRLGCALRACKAATASSVVSNVSALAFALKISKCAF